MKLLLFTGAMVFALMASSQSKEAIKEPDLDFFKHEVIANIDQRIAALTTAKTCVEAAMDKPALKECKKSLNEERQELKKEMKKAKKMKKTNG